MSHNVAGAGIMTITRRNAEHLNVARGARSPKTTTQPYANHTVSTVQKQAKQSRTTLSAPSTAQSTIKREHGTKRYHAAANHVTRPIKPPSTKKLHPADTGQTIE